MLRLLLFSVALFSTVAKFNPQRLSLGNQQYEGFIYPYIMTSIIAEKKLLLTRIDVSETFFTEVEKKLTLEPEYQHLPETQTIPLDTLNSLKITSNSMVLANKSDEDVTVYLPDPHHYLFLKAHDRNFELEQFKTIFQEKVLGKKGTFLAVQQLWREFIFVSLENNGTYFTITLRKHLFHRMSTYDNFKFIKKFFFDSEPKGLELVKNINEDTLNVVVYSQNTYCIFDINRQLQMKFKGCSKTFKNIIKIQSIKAFWKNLFLIHSIKKYESMVQIIDQSSPTSIKVCQSSYPARLVYITTIENIVVVCTETKCMFLDEKCNQIRQQFNIQSRETIEKIDLMKFPIQRKDGQIVQYVSYLIVKTDISASKIPFCTNSKNNSPGGRNNYLCQEEIQNVSKCSNLNCYTCSVTPYCYFINNKCQQILNKPVALYDSKTYANPNAFLELYSRYLYGETSSCDSPTLQCSLNKSSITSTITIKKQNKLANIENEFCTVFIMLDRGSVYRFESQSSQNYSVSQCSNNFFEESLKCEKRNRKEQQFTLLGINYILLYFTYKGQITQFPHSMESTYNLINVEQEKIYNATRLFTIIFGSFLMASVFFIAYVLLKNRILARLALWGVIPFTPSGIYPLSDVQLKLKVRQLLKKSFLIEYHYEIKQSSKEEPVSLEECSFCLEEFAKDDVIFEIYCRHKFHKVCLGDWIRKQRNSQKCPICKRGFSEAQLLYFNQNSYSYGLNRQQRNTHA